MREDTMGTSLSVKSTDVKGKIDFAIISIREDEYSDVLKRFPSDKLCHGLNRIYSLTRVLLPEGEHYLVACAPSIEQGGGHAQDVARDMIEDLDPNLLLVVGIAGAVPEREFTLGDVVVAKRLHDFSVGAALQGRSLQVTDQGGPMHKMVQNLLAQLPALKNLLGDWNNRDKIGMDRPKINPESAFIYGDKEWIDKVRGALQSHFGEGVAVRPPIITARSITSANVLIKDTETLKNWLERARELAAIEMELNGIYIAARRLEREYPILCIRGISDIVGLKREDAWTQYACETAASCAHAFVMAQLLSPKSKNSKTKEAELEPDPTRFEEFCNEFRERRVGIADEWGGEINRGMGHSTIITLPRNLLHSDALVVHAIPEAASLKPPLSVDLNKLQEQPELLHEVHNWTDHYSEFRGYHYNGYPVKRSRHNADGLLLYNSNEREDEYSDAYMQFYANGIVEVVDTKLIGEVLHSHVIPGAALEQAIVKLVPAILAAHQQIGLDGRVWVAVTILDNLEYVSVSYNKAVSKGPYFIGKKHRLLLPPILVDTHDDRSTLLKKLRTAFDALAHAGGWDRSPNAYE